MKNFGKYTDAFKKNKFYTTLGIFLLLFIITAMIILCRGSSIHGDEYFSIGFANNTEDYLFITRGLIDLEGKDGWLDGEFLHDWLSVQPGEQCSYLQIYRNVRDDVHPPAYFMLLNTISSFFKNQVTLFPGYFINIVSGILICLFLFLIARKIFRDKWLALIPPLFWFMGNGAASTITYIRMYAPLSALCLICIYLHLQILNREKTTWRLYLLMGICVMAGGLTHYYFYVMLLAAFLVTCIILLSKKKIKKALSYAASIIGGGMAAVCVYPYVIRHLLFSERGTQVQENLGNTSLTYYIGFLRDYLYTINDNVFNGHFLWAAIVLLALVMTAVVIYLQNKKKITQEKETNSFYNQKGKMNYIVICLLALIYFMILFKISYSSRWLYISPVFPLLAIMITGVFARVCINIGKKYYAQILLGITVFMMIIASILRMKEALITEKTTRQYHDTITSYQENCDVIYVFKDWNNLYDNQILELMEFDQIYAVPQEEAIQADYEKILSTRENQQNNVLLYYTIDTPKYQEQVQTISKKMKATHMTCIMEDDFAIYYLSF